VRQEHVAGSGGEAIVRALNCGEGHAAENLPEDPSGGELKLAPHLRRPRVPVSGIQRLRICSMTGFCVKTTASQPLPNCFPRLAFSRTSPRYLVMLEKHRREAATGTCRGKRWRSDCRGGQTIVKRGQTVVKRSLMLKKHPIHVVPECLYRGSSVFESAL